MSETGEQKIIPKSKKKSDEINTIYLIKDRASYLEQLVNNNSVQSLYNCLVAHDHDDSFAWNISSPLFCLETSYSGLEAQSEFTHSMMCSLMTPNPQESTVLFTVLFQCCIYLKNLFVLYFFITLFLPSTPNPNDNFLVGRDYRLSLQWLVIHYCQ